MARYSPYAVGALAEPRYPVCAMDGIPRASVAAGAAVFGGQRPESDTIP